MENELIDLYDNYSSNHIMAESKFVNQIPIIINKYHNISEYLKQINITNGETEYSSIDKTININLLIINKAFHRAREVLNENEYIYLYNLVVLETMFHELEHVYQEELKYSNEYSIEQALILLSDPYVLIPDIESSLNFIKYIKLLYKAHNYRKYYDKNHNLAPHERIANLRSYTSVLSLIDDYPEKNNGTSFYSYIANELRNIQIIKGYKLINDITNSPSLDYFKNMKGCNLLNTIDNSIFHDMNIPFEDRLLCGLELTKEEYNFLVEGIEAYEYENRRVLSKSIIDS